MNTYRPIVECGKAVDNILNGEKANTKEARYAFLVVTLDLHNIKESPQVGTNLDAEGVIRLLKLLVVDGSLHDAHKHDKEHGYEQ